MANGPVTDAVRSRSARDRTGAAVLVALLAAAWLTLVVSPTASAAGPPTFAVVVDDSGPVGAPVLVTVAGDELHGLAGWELRLAFDPAVVRYSGTRGGGGLELFGAAQTASTVRVGAHPCTSDPCAAPVPDHGRVVLATIELERLQPGSPSVVVDDVVLAGESGQRLPARAVGASTRAPATPRPSVSDGNHDGRVDRTDLLGVVASWATTHDAGDGCGASDATGDVNGDGCVDVLDVASVVAASSPSPAVTATAAVSFVVNSTADAPDASPNGICQTATPGQCTLRAAITEADRATGHVDISFNIPGAGVHQIAPATALPTINNANATVTIDGFTQAGSSVNTDPLAVNATYTVELKGKGPTSIDGLYLVSPGNVVRGLDLHGFKRDVRLYGTAAHDNVVVGNLIGLLPDGTLDPQSTLSPGASCVHIQGGASRNQIGAPGAATRNVISGCSHQGVAFYDSGTDSNLVQNNLVGLDPTGTLARPNQNHGIDVNTFTTNTMIGGSNPGEGNVVSGNKNEGVEISHGTGTLFNKVIGNFVGADLTGNAAPAYARNGDRGIRLEGVAGCNNQPCPLDAGRSTVTDNVVVQSGLGGILVDKGVHDSVIARNLFGVTLNGTPAGNTLYGVQIESGAQHNVLGPGNVIAYNENGVLITSLGTQPANSASSPTLYNTITQNSIHDNHGYGLGIDLAPFGQVNTAANADPNANGGILGPTIVSTTPASATVTTCARCVVEAFRSTGGANTYGSGITYLSSATADSSGNATVFLPSSVQGAYVTTTATDPSGNTSEFSQNHFVPMPNGNNIPPNASGSVTCSQLTCSFDGSASNDPDGTIVLYHWDFGDGASANGVTVQHAYAQAGTYTAVLTVTDSGGATGSTQVIASPAGFPPGTIAQDSFNRTVASGLGTADLGGPWSTSATSSFSVDGSTAQVVFPSGATTRWAWLPNVTAQDVDVTAAITASVASQGSWGQTGAVVARRVATNTEYRARVRFASDGSIRLSIVVLNGSFTETQIGNEVKIAGLTWSPSLAVAVRLHVSGVSPTTLQARAWAAGSTEPSTWAVSVTDATASLQTSGAVGIEGFVGSAMSSGGTLHFDDLTVS